MIEVISLYLSIILTVHADSTCLHYFVVISVPCVFDMVQASLASF